VISGKRLAESLDAVPATIKIPYLSTASPLSFASITINSNAGRYRTLRDLDMDMSRLFEKSRRYFLDGSPEYGHILVLQRLYNALTAPYPLVLPPSGIPDPSPIHFASLPAGPGNARSQHETSQEIRAGAAEHDVGHGITTFRVGTKDRKYTDEARHKGQSFKTGE
jgi:chromatin structure-remodeling complex subunit RSC1/2